MGALILSYRKRKHREQQVKWTLRGSKGEARMRKAGR